LLKFRSRRADESEEKLKRGSGVARSALTGLLYRTGHPKLATVAGERGLAA